LFLQFPTKEEILFRNKVYTAFNVIRNLRKIFKGIGKSWKICLPGEPACYAALIPHEERKDLLKFVSEYMRTKFFERSWISNSTMSGKEQNSAPPFAASLQS
jgi:hypothetical protein